MCSMVSWNRKIQEKNHGILVKKKTEQMKKHVFELPESKKPEPEDRKEEDIKKFIGRMQKHNQDYFWPKHDRACSQTGKSNRWQRMAITNLTERWKQEIRDIPEFE